MTIKINDAINQTVEAGLGLYAASLYNLGHELVETHLKIIEAIAFPDFGPRFLVQN